MTFDFYVEYCRIHQQVYGRIPCTREQWREWCAQPRGIADHPLSDIEFDTEREREGNAQ